MFEIISYTALSGTTSNVNWRAPAVSLLGTRKVPGDEEHGLWITNEKDTLYKPLNWFSKGVRRFLVETENGAMRLVSQTDCMNFILMMFDKFHLDSVTIRDTSIVSKPVIHADCNMKAVEALRKMHSHDVHGIAVIDSTGILKATLSDDDLRGLTMESMDRLQLSVLEFIKLQNSDRIPEVFKVRPEMHLRQLMQVLSQRKLHRVFVEDDSGHLTGIITITDVLGYFWNLTRDYWYSIE
jgi:CBS domain-containing protein